MSLWYSGTKVSNYKPDPKLVEYVKKHSHSDGSISYVDIPLVLADENSVEGFGYFVKDFGKEHVKIVQWPSVSKVSDGCHQGIWGGTGGGVTRGTFTSSWDPQRHCRVTNDGVGGEYDMGFIKHTHIFFQGSNNHPDSSQVFVSLDQKPFIMALSQFVPDSVVSPLHFVAFYFDGTKAFCVPAGVYHQAVFPVQDRATLESKQGKVHGVTVCDFLREFGVLARIHNAFKKPSTSKMHNFHERMASLNLIESRILSSSTQVAVNPEYEKSKAELLTEPLNPNIATDSLMEPFGQLFAHKTDPHSMNLKIMHWPTRERQVFRGNEAGFQTNKFSVDWHRHKTDELRMLTMSFLPESKCGGALLHGNREKGGDVDIYVTEMWSRPDGSQLIMPVQSQPFIILLANNHKDTNTPDVTTLTAFRIGKDIGVLLNAGVWCSRPLPAYDGWHMLKFVSISSAVNAHLFADFCSIHIKICESMS